MTDRVQPFNGRRVPSEPADVPFKHVIAEYRHRAQTITCTCGWSGSTETTDGRTSAWSLHLAEHRTTPRR